VDTFVSVDLAALADVVLVRRQPSIDLVGIAVILLGDGEMVA